LEEVPYTVFLINIALSKKSKMKEKKELTTHHHPVFYYVSGRKEYQPIVFLHPAFADHRCFDKQIEFFSAHYRVITMDMPGHGLSKPGKDKIDATIDYINSILSAEGYEKAHLVGVSMGSLIAQYFTLHYPDKVLSLTVLGGYDINADNREVAKAQQTEKIKWIFKAIFSMNAFRRHAASMAVSKPAEQERLCEMAKHFTRKSFMVMSGLSNVVKQRENVSFDYPLLILCGDKDIELAKKMSLKWHEQSPSQFNMIPDAGHCANMDNAESFNSIVMDFLKQS
jgi:3-oxoadipate enol-lactonase